MSVPEIMVREAWERTGGRCECQRYAHNHTYVRCARLLKWELRGRSAPGGWQPIIRTGFSSDIPLSCEILCASCNQRLLVTKLNR